MSTSRGHQTGADGVSGSGDRGFSVRRGGRGAGGGGGETWMKAIFVVLLFDGPRRILGDGVALSNLW